MKILYVSASDINIVGGDTIQLASELNMWDMENDVEYISRIKLFSSKIVENISPDVKLVFPTVKNGVFTPALTIENLINRIKEYDKINNYDLIIMRGSEYLKNFVKLEPELFSKKCITYLTDTFNLTDKEIKKIFKKTFLIKCQSLPYVDYYSKKFNIDRSKFLIQSPIVEDIKITEKDKEFDIIYIGKIGKGWGVLEYLKFLKENPDLKGALVYSRFLNNNEEEHDEIKELFELDNVVVYSNKTRNDTLNLLNKSKVAYGVRDIEIDNDNSSEISSKMIESMFYNVPIIVRNNKLHREIFGDDYPGLVDDYGGTKKAFENLINSDDIDLRIEGEKYLAENVYESLKKQLIEKGVIKNEK